MVNIQGRTLDERYTRLLMNRTGLDLTIIMLLDRVQKNQRISADDNKRLKAAKLVKERYPGLVVAAEIAAATGQKAKHIRDRGLDSKFYRDYILILIQEHQPVAREDIDKLLLDKLPEVLSQEQKLSKIHNLLGGMSKAGLIRNEGGESIPGGY